MKQSATTMWLTVCMLIFIGMLTPAIGAEPITIYSEFTMPPSEQNENIDELWLLTFGDDDTSAEHTLGMVWTRDTTAWIPRWSLQWRDEGQTVELDTTARLPWGHNIEAIISYHPTGVASVKVRDVADDAILFRDVIENVALTTSDTIRAGIQQRTGAFETLAVARTEAYYIPYAMEWNVVPVSDGTPQSRGIRRVIRDEEDIQSLAVRFVVPGSVPGTFHVNLEQEGEIVSLVESERIEGEFIQEFDPAQLTLGSARLIMTYTDKSGEEVLSDSITLDVGQVTVAPETVRFAPGEDDVWHIYGTLVVTNDGPFPDFPLTLQYDVDTPARRAPLHQEWRTVSGEITVDVSYTGEKTSRIEYTIPVQHVPGDPERQELFVTISPVADTTKRIAAAGYAYTTAGTREPLFPTITEYDVLRADLHIHTTLSDGQLVPTARTWESRKYGYDVISLTDHGTHRAYDFIVDLADAIDVVAIRGFESGRLDGEHFIILDIDPAYEPTQSHRWAIDPERSAISYQDHVQDIIEHGGYILYAHPGGPWLPEPHYDHPDGPYGWTEAIEWMIENNYLHAVDIRGHYTGRRLNAPFDWALEHDLTIIDVSDIHEPRDFSAGHKAPVTLLFAEERSVQGAMDALWEGRTVIWRNNVMRGKPEWLDFLFSRIITLRSVRDESSVCVEIRNEGAIPLEGAVSTKFTSGNRRIQLDAYDAVCVPVSKDDTTVTVAWLNVLSAPETPYVTELTIPGT